MSGKPFLIKAKLRGSAKIKDNGDLAIAWFLVRTEDLAFLASNCPYNI